MGTTMKVEQLENRDQPAVIVSQTGGALLVVGDADDNRITIFRDGTDIVVAEAGREIDRRPAVTVTSIEVQAGAGNDAVKVDQHILINTLISGGAGIDRLSGGGALNTILGGDGDDVLKGGLGANTFDAGAGTNNLFRVKVSDVVTGANPNTQFVREGSIKTGDNVLGLTQNPLTAQEVDILLSRAAAASSTQDAIIVVTDRNGRILGVRVEGLVDPAITGDNAQLVFAIDGALAKARTGAFFGNNAAPLTSRTIENISQSTITQREIESNPNITDPNSTVRGPGFVANTAIGGHFPRGTAFTPQVDLFQIEHTNRDGTFHVGPDRIKGTADDIRLTQRFDLEDAFVPDGQDLFPPDSYGFVSGLLLGAQARGIATLPGGVPIIRNVNGSFEVVGGLGVFFPGRTGYATEENSARASTFDPTKPDRTLEAEYIAFSAIGGNEVAGAPPLINGISIQPVLAFLASLKLNSIYLVGINLEIFGEGIPTEGIRKLLELGNAIGPGDPNSGFDRNLAIDGDANNDGDFTDPLVDPDANNDGVLNDPTLSRDGVRVPEGWLVTPHDGDGITAAEVEDIISRGIAQADATRAAIRLPLGNRSRMVFAVADKTGRILGLYRQPDATIFSIDVAVAKARNVAYYADADTLQEIDRIDNTAPGTAFTNRSFRYLGEPRFPIGIDGTNPAPFSQLNDDIGIDRFTGLQVGPRAPASQFRSVVGNDSFNPGTNFRDPNNITRQNGIVFFPGSAPLYKTGRLVGGFGVSGDGVDQDDVVTDAGSRNFGVPNELTRVDEIFIRGIRVPYAKNLRNPEG